MKLENECSMRNTRCVRLAAVSGCLDWSHRTETSNEKFNLDTARKYIEDHTALLLRLMDEAALMGADLVVGPEYFTGSELFTTNPENKRRFVESVADNSTIEKLKALSMRRKTHLACAFDMFHGDTRAQTGALTGRAGELLGVQIKNTSLPEDAHPNHEYRLFDLDIGRAAIFTCSDLTTYPEDPIAAAKRGMELLIAPGCGFGPQEYLKTRARDLACVLVHADDGRAMIFDPKGNILAETRTCNAIVYADVEMPAKQPVSRLRSGR